MIYARLAGGLGNQLFQFAASLALRGQPAATLLLSTDGLRRYRVQRSFDLPRLLVLPDGCHTDLPCDRPGQPAAALLRWRIGRLLPRHGVNDRNFARHLARQQRGGAARQPLWLDGYFQQGWPAPLFAAMCKQMQAMLRRDLPATRVPGTDCVIHIRGGDFLASDIHRVVDAGYYVAALAALRACLPGMRSACVVTDDAAHAAPIVAVLRRAEPDLALNPAPPPDPTVGSAWLQDFVLLRDARARLIGNSSFAWWAAALDAQHAPTVSPDQWMRGVPRDLVLPWEQAMSPHRAAP